MTAWARTAPETARRGVTGHTAFPAASTQPTHRQSPAGQGEGGTEEDRARTAPQSQTGSPDGTPPTSQ